MKAWDVADGDGNSVAQGWQGDERQARAIAQRRANELGAPLWFWDRALPADDESEGERVDPEPHATLRFS